MSIEPSGTSPFKSVEEALAFIRTSSAQGHKYEKLLKELEKEGAHLKIYDLGKKYHFEAGGIVLEVKKKGTKKSSFSQVINSLPEGTNPMNKAKVNKMMKKITSSLIEKKSKKTTPSEEPPQEGFERTLYLARIVLAKKPLPEEPEKLQ